MYPSQMNAMSDYLDDKRHYEAMESNNKTHAVMSGSINVKTGNVDTESSVHWHYFGKQAVRTLYYSCRKVSQTVYTWD